MLFCKSIEYALKGGAVDFTGNEDIDYWETICDEVRVCNGIKRMLDAGVKPDRMTISSDGRCPYSETSRCEKSKYRLQTPYCRYDCSSC